MIELLGGLVLFWRLRVEAGGADAERVEQTEGLATKASEVFLALLCGYVLFWVGRRPETRETIEAARKGSGHGDHA